MSIYYRFICAKWHGDSPPVRFHIACIWICLLQMEKHFKRGKSMEWRYALLICKQIYWAAKAANKPIHSDPHPSTDSGR